MRRVLFILGYLAVIVVAIGVDWAARRRPEEGRDGLPTFERVLSYVQQSRPGRAVVFVGWWWLGFHFLAR